MEYYKCESGVLDMGFEFDGCELDKEYFDDAVERIRNHSQLYLDFQEDK